MIIKLSPKKHGIDVENVAEDSVEEQTAPLHNYIADIPSIKIDESDIVCDDYLVIKPPGPVPKEKIESLEGYTRNPIPYVPIHPY